MNNRHEIYVSTDIEADGPIPGEYSMLSFASVAFNKDGSMLSSFSRNLMTLPDAKEDPNTMAFWERNKEAWEACRKNVTLPHLAMKDYWNWLTKLPGTPVFVGFPAGFDFTFIYWYLIKFCGNSPFSFSAIDIKTYAMALMSDLGYRECSKKNMPKSWFGPKKHTHVAIDDAIEQGELFMNMLNYRKSRVLVNTSHLSESEDQQFREWFGDY